MSDELKLKEEWMKRAKDQTLETLPTFLKELSEFKHDYGTICRAIAAAGIAAMWAVVDSEVHDEMEIYNTRGDAESDIATWDEPKRAILVKLVESVEP